MKKCPKPSKKLVPKGKKGRNRQIKQGLRGRKPVGERRGEERQATLTFYCGTVMRVRAWEWGDGDGEAAGEGRFDKLSTGVAPDQPSVRLSPLVRDQQK